MRNYLFKLSFDTPVRFGTGSTSAGLVMNSLNCHADTLFSAICCEIAKLFNAEILYDFCKKVSEGCILFSDLLPWKDEELFLPKPLVVFNHNMKEYSVGSDIKKTEEALKKRIADRKKLKKIQYVPVSYFHNYLEQLKKFEPIDFGCIPSISEIAQCISNVKVKVDFEEKSLPYMVNAYKFKNSGTAEKSKSNSGLFFVVRTSQDKYIDLLEKTVQSLGETGIGGKKSSGFGHFRMYEDIIEIGADLGVYDSDCVLGNMLDMVDEADEDDIQKAENLYMLLSVMIPSKNDFDAFEPEKCFYQLISRTGYVFSGTYNQFFVKKKPLMAFSAGSCFNMPLKGELVDVSASGKHPVYRYGKGLYVGVKK